MVKAGGVAKHARRHREQKEGKQQPVDDAAHQDKIFDLGKEHLAAATSTLPDFLEFLGFFVLGFGVLLGGIFDAGFRVGLLRHDDA